MLEAMEMVERTVSHGNFQRFESDRGSQMIFERGLEIVSEASRSLPAEMKQRHPEIPWRQVSAIGNKLRHEYHRLSPAMIWETARLSVPTLMTVCKAEMERALQQQPPADLAVRLLAAGRKDRETDLEPTPDHTHGVEPDYSQGLERKKKD